MIVGAFVGGIAGSALAKELKGRIPRAYAVLAGAASVALGFAVAYVKADEPLALLFGMLAGALVSSGVLTLLDVAFDEDRVLVRNVLGMDVVVLGGKTFLGLDVRGLLLAVAPPLLLALVKLL